MFESSAFVQNSPCTTSRRRIGRDHAAREWCAWEDAQVSLTPAISRIRAAKIRNIASGSRAWSRTTGGTPPSSGRTNYSVMPLHCTAFPTS
jgi:hypothetical protein